MDPATPTIYVAGETALVTDMLEAALSCRYIVATPKTKSLVPGDTAIHTGAVFATTLAQALLLLKHGRLRHPAARFIVVGGLYTETECLELIEHGASDFVRNDDSLPALIEVVHAVDQGIARCSKRLASLASVLEAPGRAVGEISGSLTFREAEVLGLVREGLSNKEIAYRLSISISTVKNHVHHILEKLKIRRRHEAIEWQSRYDVPRQPPSFALSARVK